MASILKSPSGWRAQIYALGVRKSKVFRTKREAFAWASVTESDIRSGAAKIAALKEKIGHRQDDHSLRDIMDNRNEACCVPGIYVLFLGEEVVYVGKSKNMLSRISSHAEKGRGFTHYYAMPFLEDELDDKERHYIDLLQPSDNKALT